MYHKIYLGYTKRQTFSHFNIENLSIALKISQKWHIMGGPVSHITKYHFNIGNRPEQTLRYELRPGLRLLPWGRVV